MARRVGGRGRRTEGRGRRTEGRGRRAEDGEEGGRSAGKRRRKLDGDGDGTTDLEIRATWGGRAERPCGGSGGGQGGGHVAAVQILDSAARCAGGGAGAAVSPVAMKIGFLGGSFDPIHLGHLVVAQDALEGLGLDRVEFIPAAVSPLKGRELIATPAQRLEMVRLAIGHDPRFGVLDLELRRGGTSYTVETVRELGRRYPGATFFWVIGADQLARLAEWKDIGELVQRVAFAHLARPGVEEPAAPPIPGLRLHRVAGHEVAVSSSELRERANRGLPLWPFVPLKVSEFIDSESLYRTNP